MGRHNFEDWRDEGYQEDTRAVRAKREALLAALRRLARCEAAGRPVIVAVAAARGERRKHVGRRNFERRGTGGRSAGRSEGARKVCALEREGRKPSNDRWIWNNTFRIRAERKSGSDDSPEAEALKSKAGPTPSLRLPPGQARTSPGLKDGRPHVWHRPLSCGSSPRFGLL